MQPRYRLIGVAAIVLATSACNRTVLNHEVTWDLPPAENMALKIDPAPRDQTIKVEVAATGGTVGVYVCLEADLAAVQKDVSARRTPAKSLKHEPKTASAILEVPIPANTEAAVLIAGGAKATKVTLKVTN